MSSRSGARMEAPEPNVDRLIQLDPWLEPDAHRLRHRAWYYQQARSRFDAHGGLLGPISQGHHYFGFNRGDKEGRPGVWYREWAPAASSLYLTGEFNHWNRDSHPLQQDEWGVWSLFLPDDAHAARLVHGSEIKVQVASRLGLMDRIPAYARRVIQDPDTHGFTCQYWMPPSPYRFEHPSPKLSHGLRIYEAHVGMAQEEGKIGTFEEFTRNVPIF